MQSLQDTQLFMLLLGFENLFAVTEIFRREALAA